MEQPAIRRLTDRQRDCLRLVAQGYTSKEIGRQLDLSPSTVDNHILAATQSLGAANRAEAARVLTRFETRQNLPSQTAPLAEPTISGFSTSSAEGPAFTINERRRWSLPPVGGQRNELDATERTIGIIQVAVAGFGSVMGLSLIIAGIFSLMS